VLGKLLCILQMGRIKSTAAGTSRGASDRPSKGKRVRTDPSGNQSLGQVFIYAEKKQRHDNIKSWSFIPERRVQLNEGEYEEFLQGLMRRNWMTLASPPPKFDPEIVYEFYANVWEERQPAEERRSRVRGIWVPFDPQSINNLLGNPLQFRDDDLCMYQRLRGRYDGFDDTVVSRALCLRGQRYEVGPTGKPLG